MAARPAAGGQGRGDWEDLAAEGGQGRGEDLAAEGGLNQKKKKVPPKAGFSDYYTEKLWVWALVAALLSPGGPVPAVAWSPGLEGGRGERENLLRGLCAPGSQAPPYINTGPHHSHSLPYTFSGTASKCGFQRMGGRGRAKRQNGNPMSEKPPACAPSVPAPPRPRRMAPPVRGPRPAHLPMRTQAQRCAAVGRPLRPWLPLPVSSLSFCCPCGGFVGYPCPHPLFLSVQQPPRPLVPAWSLQCLLRALRFQSLYSRSLPRRRMR